MCHFFSCRHIFLFLAGMFFSAALNHFYYYMNTIPDTHWGLALTQTNNVVFLGGALFLCVLFVFLAHRSHGTHSHCACGKERCSCSSNH